MTHPWLSANIGRCIVGVSSGNLQEQKLGGLVIDEWRGASSDNADIVCDTAGGFCPWRVANDTDAAKWNISAVAAALMVCSHA